MWNDKRHKCAECEEIKKIERKIRGMYICENCLFKVENDTKIN